MIVYVHVLAMIGGFTAMIITEILIFRKFRIFCQSDFMNVRLLSNVISISLAILWFTGIALVFVGYLNDPNYVTNQKIWGKVAVVSIMTINGFYISYRVMPRIEGLQWRNTLVSNNFESISFRFSFVLSLAGWLLASFFGIARFMNFTYHMFSILNIYMLVVLFMFMVSYVFQNAEFLRIEEIDGNIAPKRSSEALH